MEKRPNPVGIMVDCAPNYGTRGDLRPSTNYTDGTPTTFLDCTRAQGTVPVT